MKCQRLPFFAFLFSALAGLPGCTGMTDYTSQGLEACLEPVSLSKTVGTTLSPECRKALEQVVPMDATLESAPPEIKTRLLEGMQFILSYPLAVPPENRYLGVAPYSIPLVFFERFSPDSTYQNMNKNVFNYILNSIDSFRYEAGDFSSLAKYQLFDHHVRTIILHDRFTQRLASPILSAATLVHESGHADAIQHVDCDTSVAANCDNDLIGAFGFEGTYLEFVVRGSAFLKDSDGIYHLSDQDLQNLELAMCNSLKRVNHIPNDLRTIVNNPFCGMSPGNLLRAEKIERP